MAIFTIQLVNAALLIFGAAAVGYMWAVRPDLRRILTGIVLYVAARLIYYGWFFYTRLFLGLWDPSVSVTFVASLSTSITTAVFTVYAVWFAREVWFDRDDPGGLYE